MYLIIVEWEININGHGCNGYAKEGYGFYVYKSEIKLLTKKNTIMSNIIEFAKNLVLSDSEKLLRKHGLKNECGFTCEAKEIVMNKLVADNEEYLLAVATKQEEETKKSK